MTFDHIVILAAVLFLAYLCRKDIRRFLRKKP